MGAAFFLAGAEKLPARRLPERLDCYPKTLARHPEPVRPPLASEKQIPRRLRLLGMTAFHIRIVLAPAR